MKVRAHLTIRGMVQGVFFRASVRDTALMFDISGWVKNAGEDKVEAIFEGEKEQVEKIVNYCRIGPPGAKVADVEVKWEEFKGEFKDFKIIYR